VRRPLVSACGAKGFCCKMHVRPRSGEVSRGHAVPAKVRIRGPHPGTGGGQGGPVSHGGAGRVGEKAESNGDYPQGGKTPSDSIKARSRRAPDGGARYVSVLTDSQGNFRLSAGTLLDFRTQSQ